MDSHSIGIRLRARRRELGLTLAAVAERAGVSVPYIANIEHGRGNPTVEKLRKIAEALETNLPELLGEGASRIDESLATLPEEIAAFSRTPRFAAEVDDLAERRNEPAAQIRQQLLSAMAAAPRRAAGNRLTEMDLNRLFDTFVTILRER
jgi:transcriptional regulator with XRE-family HTH domain